MSGWPPYMPHELGLVACEREIVVRTALMAGPVFRYPWAEQASARAVEDLMGGRVRSPWMTPDEDGLDTTFLDARVAPLDARYTIARFGVWDWRKA